jgi:hypothetical protein
MMTTRRLRALEAVVGEVETTRQELDEARTAAETAKSEAQGLEDTASQLLDRLGDKSEELDVQFKGLHAVIQQVTGERDDARQELAAARGELEATRSQVLLDAEDRVVLRMLLKQAKKQAARPERVFVLFRHGELHSVHASRDDAEAAAEAEGAPRDGWTWHGPGEGVRPAQEVAWRVRTVPLGGTR